MGGTIGSGVSAEIVFSGRSQLGFTSSDVNVDEVRMIVDEGQLGFGFSKKNEIINGKAAIIGFLLLLDFELLTGKGLLKGTGFLDSFMLLQMLSTRHQLLSLLLSSAPPSAKVCHANALFHLAGKSWLKKPMRAFDSSTGGWKIRCPYSREKKFKHICILYQVVRTG